MANHPLHIGTGWSGRIYAKYGNSALEPLNLFHKGIAENSIAIRLDDKLSRIKNSEVGLRTNDICDIIGYFVLLLVSKGISGEDIARLKD